jgi:tetratricopeptide (TPR) repeat protein
VPKHFTYGAFLSYSPVNADVAERVGRRFEQLRIDRGPVQRAARVGPVFRDRCEIFARARLTGETVAALADSAALIVLASPHSAQSQHVNRQVALFKLRHPERPVISLLVERPNSAEPRFAVVPDWCKRLADAAPLDLDEGDGLDLAVAKIAGRLLGVSPYDISEGAERTRQRRARIWTVAVTAAAVLATAAGAALWQSQRQARAWADVARLIDKYERATPTQAADPGAKESLIRAFTAMAEDGKREPRYFQVLELLNAGKLVESEKLLSDLAEERARRSARDGAAAYRTLASVAAISDPVWAREYYAEATRLDPSNVEGLFRNGWLLQAAGQVDAAEASYRRLIASVQANNDQWALWAYLGTGDIERERGHFDGALANYQAAGDIAESLAEIDHGNSRWQYDIAVTHQHIGDLLFGLGDRANALQHYQAQEAVLSRLDTADRGRGPVMAPVRVADVPVPRDGAGAMLASFRKSLAHLERLAKADRTDAGWQRDLAIAYARTGSLLMWQDNLPETLTYFSASLSILDRLERLDPGNVLAARSRGLSCPDR